MRRYIITLVFLALLIGSLFKAAEQTGVAFMRMFATIGIFFFGLVGTLAINRWQISRGLKEIDERLKALEPQSYITDWCYQDGGRPDYLVVGPGGLLAICLDETAQSVGNRRAAARIARGRSRAEAAASWLRDRLKSVAGGLNPPRTDFTEALPVNAVLVLTRRQSLPEQSDDGVTVLNPGQLGAFVASIWDHPLLADADCILLTRLLRHSVASEKVVKPIL